MKKILVTGESFTGTVTVMYGDSGMGADIWPPIVSVDLAGAMLGDKQKAFLLSHAPLHYGPGFEQEWGVEPGKLHFVTEDYELDFERDFFVPYCKPVNKARCLKLWANMSIAKRHMAVGRRPAYDRHLERNQWKSKADPETYLKKEMYLNDYDKIL